MNLPADQITLGKMYLHMKSRLNEDEYKDIYEKLGPFPTFKIRSNFFSAVGRDDEEKIGNNFLHCMDEYEKVYVDINEALNAFTRVKNKFRDFITFQGYLDISLSCSYDKKNWSDFLNDRIKYLTKDK